MRNDVLLICSVLFCFAQSVVTSMAKDNQSHEPIKCGFMDAALLKKQKDLIRTQGTDRPNLPLVFLSASGRFHIHYSTQGTNAVPAADLDLGGIPDYVDSAAKYFDDVVLAEVDGLGYPLPPSDDTTGGGVDVYDIYLVDLAKDGIYGVTFIDEQVNGTSPARYNSFIQVDNDFSENDLRFDTSTGKEVKAWRTLGLGALRITAFHEYHHAIQLGMGAASEFTSFNEMASTFMEWRFAREITDYEQFLNGLMSKLHLYYISQNSFEVGYRYAVLAQFLYTRFGDNWLKRSFEMIGAGESPYFALDQALQESQTSLSAEYDRFLGWMYRTGYRSGDSTNSFDRAGYFPLVQPFDLREFQHPSIVFEGELKPYEMRFFRCLFSETDRVDTLDVFIVDTAMSNWKANKMSPRSSPYQIIITKNSTDTSFKTVAGTSLNYRIVGSTTSSLVSFAGLPANNILFPTPFIFTKGSAVSIPTPRESKGGSLVRVSLYTPEMGLAFSRELPVEVEEIQGKSQRVIKLSRDILPSDIGTGVYVLFISSQEEQIVSKLLIQQ